MALKHEPVGSLVEGSWKCSFKHQALRSLSCGIQGQLSCSVSCSVVPEPKGEGEVARGKRFDLFLISRRTP